MTMRLPTSHRAACESKGRTALRRRGSTYSRGSAIADGFTLIETALATVIIGVGVTAMVESQMAFMKSNSWSSTSASATYLANEIRELTRNLPKHDPVNGLYLLTSGGASTLHGWGPQPGSTGASDFNHIDAFDNMKFTYNGSAGFTDGNLPGPVDAFGNIIPDIDSKGNILVDSSGNPRPMNGWTQEVHVTKVDPFNNSITYANDATLPANSATGFKGLAVDKFPLRVSVTVKYRGVYDSADSTIASVSWVVP